MYIRMATELNTSMRSAYVEFTDQKSIATSLTYSGVSFMGLAIKYTNMTQIFIFLNPIRILFLPLVIMFVIVIG